MFGTETELKGLRAIVQTRRDILAAKKTLNKQIENLYPVGSHIGWQKGGNNLSGTVKMHDGGTRIQVENSLTLKIYWIDIYDVLQRHGA